MEGYKFTTEKKAQEALRLVNDSITFPVESITNAWTTYVYAGENVPAFYFIPSDEYTDTILKAKETFTIIYEDY